MGGEKIKGCMEVRGIREESGRGGGICNQHFPNNYCDISFLGQRTHLAAQSSGMSYCPYWRTRALC